MYKCLPEMFIKPTTVHVPQTSKINCRDVQGINVVNNVDMSMQTCQVWRNHGSGPYKNQHTEQHKYT